MSLVHSLAAQYFESDAGPIQNLFHIGHFVAHTFTVCDRLHASRQRSFWRRETRPVVKPTLLCIREHAICPDVIPELFYVIDVFGLSSGMKGGRHPLEGRLHLRRSRVSPHAQDFVVIAFCLRRQKLPRSPYWMNALFKELQKIKNRVKPATRTPVPLSATMLALQ